ncbi:uncharacterized protein PAC_04798 [Phialocephala subalpina]|uniref:Zn(2)-C6 fungal-type domain-containing protein n=1 Tax=Phialocephala subalpina TaxID=576137 RepID=A0A1L7WQ65_9HELO|nr:uncharacterized protein PAC_04798 [Phialocephala subalpina]
MSSPSQTCQSAAVSPNGQVTGKGKRSSTEENTQSDRSESHPKQRVKVYPERINRVRAKKPKSRNGCRTCKIRRVKCGEERPCCAKCQRFGIACDGYEKPAPPSRAAVTKPLLPRTVYELPLCILPTSAPFKSELEHQYFLHFRDEVTFNLSGPVPTKMWNYVILQATHNTTALRDLTVSIAALTKAKACPELASWHRTFAIRQYGKALTELRQAINRSDDSAVRISLIASLLIFCFENIHGDYEQAVVQLRTALQMMRRRLATVARPYSRIRTICTIPGLEDDILDIFVRLDNTIMSRVGKPTDCRDSILAINYLDEAFHMPKVFQDVVQAKNYLEHVQYKTMPYLSHMPDVFMYGDQYNYRPPKHAFDEIEMHLRDWARAFKPLLEDAERRGGTDFIAAGTLRVLALATDLAVQRVFLGAAGSTHPELFAPEAMEVVALSRKIVSNRSFKKTFVFDCGIVPTLFVVVTNCWKRSLREEAIEVLESCGERMEVTWNAAAVAQIGRQILQAEDAMAGLA